MLCPQRVLGKGLSSARAPAFKKGGNVMGDHRAHLTRPGFESASSFPAPVLLGGAQRVWRSALPQLHEGEARPQAPVAGPSKRPRPISRSLRAARRFGSCGHQTGWVGGWGGGKGFSAFKRDCYHCRRTCPETFERAAALLYV